MKYTHLVIFVLINWLFIWNVTISAKTHTFFPDNEGYLGISGEKAAGILAGDIIQLRGNFKSVWIVGLNGSAQQPVVITNYPGEVVTIGNPGWDGGPYAQGIRVENCHHIILGGEKNASEFIINGSTENIRASYFNMELGTFTDNIEIKNMIIKDGGTGIWAKTDPKPDDPDSWYPNAWMNNLYIHHVTITNTMNEGMYIGHTAPWWNQTTNTYYYGDPSGFVPGNVYKQPIKWRNLKISDCYLYDIGLDGIQTAAIDKLEICDNEVTNWAMSHNYSHNGGILIGGRTTNTNTHDNYVHDGWGEMCQFYGSGESNATHVIHNNLFHDNQGDGVSLRGTDGAIVRITNNTIARCGDNTLRISGLTGMAGAHISRNAFIQPRMNVEYFDMRAYIYDENGASATEGTGTDSNIKIRYVENAMVDIGNYYLPLSGSPIKDGTGYRRHDTPANPTAIPASHVSLNDTDCKVYPTVTNDVIHVSTERATLIQVIDISGTILKSIIAEESVTTINLDSYPGGVYLIKVKNKVIKIMKR